MLGEEAIWIAGRLAALGADWYWEQDEHGRYTVLAPRADLPSHSQSRTFLGRRRWELPGFRPLNFRLEDHLEQVRRREPFRDLQFCFDADGQSVCLAASGQPRLGQDGEFLGWRGVGREITRECNDRRAREDAERLLHMAAQLGRFGGWSVDLVQRRCTWSDQVCAIHDLAPGYSCSMDEGLAFYAREDQPAVRAAVDRCLAEGGSFDFEARIVTARGRRVWVRAIGHAVRDESGRIHRVEGALQDVEALRALADERQRIADTMTATLHSLADGFLLLDHDWRIAYANPEALRIVQRDALVGQDLWAMFPEAVGTIFETEYRRAVASRMPVEFQSCYTPLQLWLRVRAWPTSEGLAVSFVDITAQKHAESQLADLNAQLEQRVRDRTAQLEAATRELQTLTYAIAHDVRAPLATIAGFGEALERMLEGQLPPRASDYLRRIRAAAGLLDEMTGGLLQLARIGPDQAAPRRLDVTALAHQAWALVQAQDPSRPVQARIQPGMQALGVAAQVASILQNLLGNAWKFTAAQSAPCIDVDMDAAAGESVFRVRDNGVGFDMAYAHRLFKPFHRLHGREIPGTGLGLATVDKLARVQGGRAWAEGRLGEGATFYFALPAVVEDRP